MFPYCVSINNIVVLGYEGPSNQVADTDQSWQALNIPAGIGTIEDVAIEVSLSRRPGFENTSMEVRLFEGIGVSAPAVEIASLNFISFNGNEQIIFPGLTLSSGNYTLQLDAPGTSSPTYDWDARSELPGDLTGSESGATLLWRLSGESCDAIVDVTTPVATGYGPEGEALVLNGDNHGATVPLIPTSGSFTVSVWAKQNTDQTGVRAILAQGSNFYIGHYFTGESIGSIPDANDPPFIRVGDNWGVTNAKFPRDNQWHNYTVVRDEAASDTYLYVDGVLADAAGFLINNPIAEPGETNDFVVGDQWSQDGAEEFDGSIDEVRVWDYALTPSEVNCNQNSDLDIYNSLPPTGLVAYYDFEDLNEIGPLGNRITFADVLVMDDGLATEVFEPSLDVIGVWDYVSTTTITDEAQFDVLTNGQYQVESYDDRTMISDLEGFSLSGPRVDPPADPAGAGCVVDGTQAVLWTDELTITFDAPITAFATYLTDLGDFGGSGGIVLTTNTGETWSEPVATNPCREIFTGIVTGTPFTSITIDVLPNNTTGDGDGVYIDRTFYGQQAFTPGAFALEQIPSEINWIVSDIANSETCQTTLNVTVPPSCQTNFVGGSEDGANNRSKAPTADKVDFEISLAPNPSDGLVAIGLKGLYQDTDMYILDLTGRQVHKERVMANTIKVFVDVAEDKYENGVYVVAFRLGEQLVTKKLVVMK